MTTPRDHGFEDLADHLGSAYLRYSFTKGTEQEVAFLVDALGLEPGMRVLDVGCGPGRHAHALGRRGIGVHGIDISQRFIDLADEDAPGGVSFERVDARTMAFDQEFDAAISLCQGAFGLADWGEEATTLDPDIEILNGIARALKPGGRAGVTAFSAYFQVRHVEAMGSEFHAERGVNHEKTTIKDEQGRDARADLWTTCFTPRELRLMAKQAGLTVEEIWSVTPGGYTRDEPTLESEEFLLVARKEQADWDEGASSERRKVGQSPHRRTRAGTEAHDEAPARAGRTPPRSTRRSGLDAPLRSMGAD